jgi:hypothetical protein
MFGVVKLVFGGAKKDKWMPESVSTGWARE